MPCRNLILAIVSTLLTQSGIAYAAPITLEFSGVIIGSTDPSLPAIGETFDGVLVYDDAVVDQTADPTRGDYAIVSLDVVYSGGLVFSSIMGNLTVEDAATDLWGVAALDGTNPNLQFGLILEDPSGLAVTGDGLIVPLLPDYANVSGGPIDFGIPAIADHSITTLLSVPEPSAALLVTLGLGILAVRGRLRQRA